MSRQISMWKMGYWFLRKPFISSEAIVVKMAVGIAPTDLKTKRVNSVLFCCRGFNSYFG
jgi:adenine-specific DNA methylase